METFPASDCFEIEFLSVRDDTLPLFELGGTLHPGSDSMVEPIICIRFYGDQPISRISSLWINRPKIAKMSFVKGTSTGGFTDLAL
jgi:hypothetical protein